MAALAASLNRVATVFESHARTYRPTWRATVMVSFLNPVLFLLSMGVLLGKLVDAGNADLGGLSYMEFVAPGLLASTAMQVGTNEASFPVMAGLRWVKTYHAVVATPASVSELVAGVFMWVAVRVIVSGIVFSAIAAAAGAFTSPLAVLAPGAALLCGLAFAAPLAALVGRLNNEQILTAVFRFALLPMFLFSGTFFPVSRLPDWLEPIAWATPLWHGVELCRDLAHGTAAAGATTIHIGYLACVILGGAAVAVHTMKGKLLS